MLAADRRHDEGDGRDASRSPAAFNPRPAAGLHLLPVTESPVGVRMCSNFVRMVALLGTWREGEGVADDDADELAWLTRSEIVEPGLPTAPAPLPLIDLAPACCDR